MGGDIRGDFLVPEDEYTPIDVGSLPLTPDQGSEFYVGGDAISRIYNDIMTLMSTRPWKTADLINQLPTFKHLAPVTREKNTFKAVARLKERGLIEKCGVRMYRILAPGVTPKDRRSGTDRRQS